MEDIGHEGSTLQLEPEDLADEFRRIDSSNDGNIQREELWDFVSSGKAGLQRPFQEHGRRRERLGEFHGVLQLHVNMREELPPKVVFTDHPKQGCGGGDCKTR